MNPPRTKEPRRPTRRDGEPPWDNRPINPNRDARVSAAFDRGDSDNAFVEFIMDPEHPLPAWVRIGKLIAYRSDPDAVAKIVDITQDPQHVYEIAAEWIPDNEAGLLAGARIEYKWLSNTGEPDFETTFMPHEPKQ
jgi:hypothetical protein